MIIPLQIGTAPWLGSAHAEMVDELHYHDLPLISVVRVGEDFVLARCIIGEIEPVNVWTYTPLTDADLKTIDDLTPETFDDSIESIGSRSKAVAVAFDGYGIVAWTDWADWASRQEALTTLESPHAQIGGLTSNVSLW